VAGGTITIGGAGYGNAGSYVLASAVSAPRKIEYVEPPFVRESREYIGIPFGIEIIKEGIIHHNGDIDITFQNDVRPLFC
jgi:hypothetical protein